MRCTIDAVTLRVLTADDDHDTADTTAELLRLDGHEVRVAYDGQQAVAIAGTFWPHIAILDINMPLMDGYLAAAALRKLETTGHRFVLIAHSARTTPLDLERARRAGFDHHVAKPARSGSMQKLVNASARVVSGAGQHTNSDALDLAAVSGLDQALGLHMFDGDAELYLSVLSTFATAYAAGMPADDIGLQADGKPGAESAAHSLRSASGYIGATAIAEAAASLEALCIAHPGDARIAVANDALQAMLIEFVRRLKAALSHRS